MLGLLIEISMVCFTFYYKFSENDFFFLNLQAAKADQTVEDLHLQKSMNHQAISHQCSKPHWDLSFQMGPLWHLESDSFKCNCPQQIPQSIPHVHHVEVLSSHLSFYFSIFSYAINEYTILTYNYLQSMFKHYFKRSHCNMSMLHRGVSGFLKLGGKQ